MTFTLMYVIVTQIYDIVTMKLTVTLIYDTLTLRCNFFFFFFGATSPCYMSLSYKSTCKMKHSPWCMFCHLYDIVTMKFTVTLIYDTFTLRCNCTSLFIRSHCHPVICHPVNETLTLMYDIVTMKFTVTMIYDTFTLRHDTGSLKFSISYWHMPLSS